MRPVVLLVLIVKVSVMLQTFHVPFRKKALPFKSKAEKLPFISASCVEAVGEVFSGSNCRDWPCYIGCPDG